MRKIMIVDDEYLVRVGIKSFLDWEAHGYCIVGEAADGEEALRKIEQERPDVVLTDLKMSGMDGFELISRCRKLYPHIKFIVLSSFDDVENVKRAMKLGAKDYTFKLKAKPQDLLDILGELTYDEPVDEMERLVRKNLPAIKGRLIHLAAHHEYSSAGELISEFKELGLTTDFTKPYAVILFNARSDSGQVGDAQVTKYALENMIQEILSEKFSVETYNYVGDNLISIISVKNYTSDAISAAAQEAFGRIFEYVNRYLGLHMEAALSPNRVGLEQFSTAISICRRLIETSGNTISGRLLVYGAETRQEIQMVKQYISEHISQDFTVGQASKMCNMSESYFSHLFKREVGMSFVDYVNQQRIRRAENLLTRTDMRISEIANAVGVDNPNYFSIMFKKLKGEAPQDYRTRLRKSK